MFAIVRTGGKQYRVAAGDKIVVEKLAGEAGDTITLGDVLLAGDGGELKSTDGPHRLGRDHRPGEGRQGHRLQEEAAPQLPPQARPSPAATILRIVAIGDQKARAEEGRGREGSREPAQAEAAPAEAPAKAKAEPRSRPAKKAEAARQGREEGGSAKKRPAKRRRRRLRQESRRPRRPL